MPEKSSNIWAWEIFNWIVDEIPEEKSKPSSKGIAEEILKKKTPSKNCQKHHWRIYEEIDQQMHRNCRKNFNFVNSCCMQF